MNNMIKGDSKEFKIWGKSSEKSSEQGSEKILSIINSNLIISAKEIDDSAPAWSR